MDANDVAKFLLITSAGLFLTTIGFAVAWLRARERILRSGADRIQPPEPAASLRVDHAVEAIALEVERIGEQQRFLTKLLADRAGVAGQRVEVSPSAEMGRPAGSSPRIITPH